MKSFITITLVLFAASVALAQPFEEWVARYNGPRNGADIAEALAVDAEGNVYVTGFSYNEHYNQDYATVKYEFDGTQLWVARYDGPGNGSDAAFALGVDAEGNVYVTGKSTGSEPYCGYATIKYDSNGDSVWVARYKGTGEGFDIGHALAVDGEGNVYVTGESKDSGTTYDYATIKYDSNGDSVWVARYDGPGNYEDRAYALAVDGEGNVYVTGKSWSDATYYDYATIKYDSNGDSVWVARYNGPGSGTDWANDLAVDAGGNVYITGWSEGSDGFYDYATLKYDSNGNPLWVARYSDPVHRDDEAYALAVDAEGYVYVTGYSHLSDISSDYTTIKYDPGGNQLWLARYNGPDSKNDYAEALALDAEGNVYVTGISDDSDTHYDYATIKYDSNGNELWVARYDAGENLWDEAHDLAVDASGNVYVTGESMGSGTGRDYATIKYSQQLPVEVTITPHNPPIEIPPEGGHFRYDGTITNNTDTSVVVDAWAMVRLPNQSYYGPVKLYENIPLGPHQSRSADNIRQNVPGYAPAGQYRYIGFVGDYPDVKQDSSYFDFTKLGTVGSYASKVESWQVFGFFEEPPSEPFVTSLHTVYPNPFNAEANISYSIANPCEVRLEVFDLLGRKVATLVDSEQPTGVHSLIWDAFGQASGVYFYKLTAGDFSGVRRMTLLK